MTGDDENQNSFCSKGNSCDCMRDSRVYQGMYGGEGMQVESI